ncbi:hypothetical protein [Candidatus Mycoplasma haematohominis]|uniref:hypothetical protein n=1 Tax=Candidatus Mycoplasma haematohominis TaxID=1494318 RepID=UPI001C0A72EA|nr:hypothetical protein [Candidatus Mycoplasma haemohominis]
MSIAKAAAGGTTALALAAGGYGVSALFTEGMPEYEVLSTLGNNSPIKDYKHYFIDTEKPENAAWWDWVYANVYSLDVKGSEAGRPTSKFQNLKKASENANNNLKKVCKDAYDVTDKSNIVSEKSSSSNTKFYERDIWRYCSEILGSKPKFISGATKIRDSSDSAEKAEDTLYSSENSYGKKYKDNLVSIYEPSNKSFWDLKNKEFFGKSKKKNWTNVGSSATGTLFANLYKQKDKSVKDVCLEAYSKDITTGVSEASETDVFKFCSLSGSKQASGVGG